MLRGKSNSSIFTCPNQIFIIGVLDLLLEYIVLSLIWNPDRELATTSNFLFYLIESLVLNTGRAAKIIAPWIISLTTASGKTIKVNVS